MLAMVSFGESSRSAGVDGLLATAVGGLAR